MALAFISAAPCSRTLGGKRWLGDKPCQGRQPPEAGAAGPPLQGLPPSHTRPPRSTADPRDAASSAIYARIHAAGNSDQGHQLALIAAALREFVRDNDLGVRVDGCLCVIGLDEAILRKRGKTGGGMNLRFTGGHELDSFWECCRPPTSMAYRTPI